MSAQELGVAGHTKFPLLDSTEQEAVDFAFTYHAPTEDMLPKFGALRDAARVFACTVMQTCPPSPDRTAAMRQIADAVMTANRSIALGGKGVPR